MFGVLVNVARAIKGTIDYGFSQDEFYVNLRKETRRQFKDAKEQVKANYQEFKDIKDGKIVLPLAPKREPMPRWKKILLAILIFAGFCLFFGTGFHPF